MLARHDALFLIAGIRITRVPKRSALSLRIDNSQAGKLPHARDLRKLHESTKANGAPMGMTPVPSARPGGPFRQRAKPRRIIQLDGIFDHEILDCIDTGNPTTGDLDRKGARQLRLDILKSIPVDDNLKRMAQSARLYFNKGVIHVIQHLRHDLRRSLFIRRTGKGIIHLDNGDADR